MDFDNPKVYGDTSISDGLVLTVFAKVFIQGWLSTHSPRPANLLLT